MALLPPTVVGPLSECSRSVRVQNQITGSTVTLLINGSPTIGGNPVGGGFATWADQRFNLNPGIHLHGGDKVTATQSQGGTTSNPSSTPVEVQKKPPTIGTVHYGSHLYVCGQCIWVDGAIPGAIVEVKQAGNPIGSADAPDGIARIGLTTPIGSGQVLDAQQSACGTPGTVTPSPMPDTVPTDQQRRVPAPTVDGPLRACQRGVAVSDVFEGAQVTLHRSTGPDAQACFDLSALIFPIAPLVQGEQVSARQEFPRCEVGSLPSNPPVTVGPAQPVPAPVVVPPLCAGGTSVRVGGLMPGSQVQILQNGVDLGTAEAFQQTVDFDVPPLAAGAHVTARQELCTFWSLDSNQVTVNPRPAALPTPVVPGPLFECSSIVRVEQILPGASVLVLSTLLGAPISPLVPVFATHADIHVAPLLIAGDHIFAVQIGCGLTNAQSAAVAVKPLGAVQPPRVRSLLTECMRSIPVDGVVPGADVDVYVDNQWLNTATADATSVDVPVPSNRALKFGDVVTARQRICITVTEFGPAARVSIRAVAVTTQHNDNKRTGANLQEVVLTPSNVRPNTFGKIFSRMVDGEIYAQPLYLCSVTVPNQGMHNIVYVATMHNSVYAFDADDPNAGVPLWCRSLGPSAPLPDGNIGPGGYADIAIEVGILSTPVISTAHNALYVVAFTREGGAYHHRLHALDLTTGQELFHGPRLIDATVPGTGQGSSNGQITFTSHLQLQRAALTLANDRVYVAFASYGDRQPYHGWVLGFDAATLEPRGVFVTTPNTGLGGIWQAGQGLVVDDQGNLYCMTGNGGFKPDGTELSDSFVKLRPDLTLADWFSPFNNSALDAADKDLGSAGPLLIPGTQRLLGGGKEGKLYLLDISGPNTMGHFQTGSDSQIVQSFVVNQDHHIHGGPAYWDFPNGPWIYVWSENDFLRAFKFAGGLFQTAPISVSTTVDPTGVPGGSPGMPGGFLSVSAIGSDPASGIIWASHPYKASANQAVVAGVLRAYLASDLTRELWNSKINAARDDTGLFAKFCPPTVANGKVYLATFSKQLAVYGLLD